MRENVRHFQHILNFKIPPLRPSEGNVINVRIPVGDGLRAVPQNAPKRAIFWANREAVTNSPERHAGRSLRYNIFLS